MEFVRFLNNRQQEVFSRQREDRYSAIADGEVSAAMGLLSCYRLFFRLLMMPKVLVHYFLVCTGFARAPRAVLDEKKPDPAADARMMAKIAQDLKVGKGHPRRLDS